MKKEGYQVTQIILSAKCAGIKTGAGSRNND
jgi:hypothetical protein